MRALVSHCGFTDVNIFTYNIRNLDCLAIHPLSTGQDQDPGQSGADRVGHW